MNDRDGCELLAPTVRWQLQTCWACPDQWEGQFSNGDYFYFRYRSGLASLGVSKDSMKGAVEASFQNETAHGEDMQGAFDTHAERQEVFQRLLESWGDEDEEDNQPAG